MDGGGLCRGEFGLIKAGGAVMLAEKWKLTNGPKRIKKRVE
jgi:hypothetical protein